MERIGWIKIHRAIIESGVWKESADVIKLFVWLLCEARYQREPEKYPSTTVRRGELLTSLRAIADANKWVENKGIRFWSASKVSRMLDRLSLPMADPRIKWTSNSDGTHIKVCNYERYQDDEQQQRTTANNSEQPWNNTEQQRDTYKEYKEGKEREEDNTPLTPQGESEREEPFQLQQDELPIPDDDPASIESEFAEFWDAFPKKRNKGQARKAFSKAIGQVSGSKIIERTLAYASSIYVTSRLGTDDERYIPLASTWLNAESYNDDPRNWNIPRKDPTNGQSRPVRNESPARPRTRYGAGGIGSGDSSA